MNSSASQSEPDLFYSLSSTDQEMYIQLQTTFTHLISSPFSQLIPKIKEFCIQGEKDDLKRCYVCGISWFSDAIAINMDQLRILTGFSKPSINYEFRKMGYIKPVLYPLAQDLILQLFPFLSKRTFEISNWKVLQFSPVTPIQNPMIKHDRSTSNFQTPQPELPVLRSMTPPPNSNSFYDDPFCLPPLFLFENSNVV